MRIVAFETVEDHWEELVRQVCDVALVVCRPTIASRSVIVIFDMFCLSRKDSLWHIFGYSAFASFLYVAVGDEMSNSLYSVLLLFAHVCAGIITSYTCHFVHISNV